MKVNKINKELINKKNKSFSLLFNEGVVIKGQKLKKLLRKIGEDKEFTYRCSYHFDQYYLQQAKNKKFKATFRTFLNNNSFDYLIFYASKETLTIYKKYIGEWEILDNSIKETVKQFLKEEGILIEEERK